MGQVSLGRGLEPAHCSGDCRICTQKSSAIAGILPYIALKRYSANTPMPNKVANQTSPKTIQKATESSRTDYIQSLFTKVLPRTRSFLPFSKSRVPLVPPFPPPQRDMQRNSGSTRCSPYSRIMASAMATEERSAATSGLCASQPITTDAPSSPASDQNFCCG